MKKFDVLIRDLAVNGFDVYGDYKWFYEKRSCNLKDIKIK